MDLRFEGGDLSRYTSGAQVARVVTEKWAERNLYCAACASNRLERTPNNRKAVDLVCPLCGEGYQLKSGKTMPRTRIVDAAYDAMVAAVRSDKAPNLLYMHYALASGVRDLLLVPRFFFNETCVERRKPLGPNARRKGWVGCNIRVDLIAPEGKITMVAGGEAAPTMAVREGYSRLRPLGEKAVEARGWTLDVLELLHRKGLEQFTLTEAYTLEGDLSARYPNNHNVRPKIRQQLQVLRDMGVVEFLQRGVYRLR